MPRFTAEQVAQALRLGEDSRNDFKSVAEGLPKRVAATLCAFANSGGGWLWLGVGDSGVVEGVPPAQVDGLLTGLDNVFATQITPALYCPVHKIEHEGKLLIVVEVRPYLAGRPYRVDRVFYLRASASNQEMPDALWRQMTVSAAAQFSVQDEHPVPRTTRADLDDERFRDFHRRAYQEPAPVEPAEFEHLLASLRVVTPDGLSLMGLLCFGKDPQQFLPLARISAARTKGVTIGTGDLDRKEFGGVLEAQILGVEGFLDHHLGSPVEVRGFLPEKSTGISTASSLPREVVREAVCNAVAHRDYAIASQIIVTLYDDRLEVQSPGTLLNSITIDAIRAGARMERNPGIVGIQDKLGYMSRRGQGVRRMIASMVRHGLPEPEFELRGPSFVVTLRMRTRS